MKPRLIRLVEAARSHVMSPEERREQAISFAYGNIHRHDPRVTRELVASMVDRTRGEGR